MKNRCKRGLLTVLVFHGNNRSIDDRRLSKYKMVVTTYQTVVREAQAETGMYKVKKITFYIFSLQDVALINKLILS